MAAKPGKPSQKKELGKKDMKKTKGGALSAMNFRVNTTGKLGTPPDPFKIADGMASPPDPF